ncbi:MAG: YggS family pyridoxal phosphate-dependent enzyme [Treponema sp.]|jgi:pyridoxal phosphate enzyme (YggS family)|nr:YggS family pyridoxal phosphate-dependent enzyme [Treponema sp.]
MSVTGNIERTEEKIQRACEASGRKREEITLLGVSKFHGREAVEEAWRGGIRCFGESRVQEGAEKFSGFRETHPGFALHMIGTLQRNKVKAAFSLFDCIQSVDRDDLIRELGKHREKPERPLELLLELHTGEESKSGFPGLEDLYRALDLILAYPCLSVRGLMTMAPFTQDRGLIRSSFRQLKTAQRELEKRFPSDGRTSWACISMGMSNDFETAIEEGSTLLRIGTAIFGERLP